MSTGCSLHRAILDVRVDRRDVHDEEGRCGVTIDMWVLRAAVRQVEIASDIGHAPRGARKLSDKIEDAVLLKLVVYKPRLGAGEAVEMAADSTAAREKITVCFDAGKFAAQLFSQCRKPRF